MPKINGLISSVNTNNINAVMRDAGWVLEGKLDNGNMYYVLDGFTQKTLPVPSQKVKDLPSSLPILEIFEQPIHTAH